MTFKLDLEPPKGARDDANLRTWLMRLWNLLHGWFNKIYSLGTGLTLDSSDQISIDTTVVPTIPVPLGDIQDIASDRLLGRDTAGSGEIEQLTVGGGVEFTGSGGIRTSAFTGDVTKTAGGTALTIANDAVTNAMLRNSSGNSVIGRAAFAAGDPADIVASTVGTILGKVGTDLEFFAPNLDYMIHDLQCNQRVLYGAAAASPPTLAFADPSIVSGTDPDAYFVGAVFGNTAVTWLAFSFTIPPEYDTTVDTIIIRCFFVIASAASANVELSIIWGGFKDGDDSATPFINNTANKVIDISGYAAGDYVAVEFEDNIGGISGANRIQGVLERDATAGNGDDDYADLIGVVQLSFHTKRKLS